MDQWQKKYDLLAIRLEALKKGNDQAVQAQIKLIEDKMTQIKQKMEAYHQALKADEEIEGKLEPGRKDF